MERVGNADAVRHGGGIITTVSLGSFLEYTDGAEGEPSELEVFRALIENDILHQYNIITTEAADLCEFLGRSLPDWLLSARSPDPIVRANCVIDVGTFFGWDNVDEEPLVLSPEEIQQRWFPLKGAVTEKGVFCPGLLAPQLAGVLHRLDRDLFWQLFGKPFPVLPAAAFVDADHIWWRAHGVQAVNRLVEYLAALAPSGFTFSVKNEAFGFWRER